MKTAEKSILTTFRVQAAPKSWSGSHKSALIVARLCQLHQTRIAASNNVLIQNLKKFPMRSYVKRERERANSHGLKCFPIFFCSQLKCRGRAKGAGAVKKTAQLERYYAIPSWSKYTTARNIEHAFWVLMIYVQKKKLVSIKLEKRKIFLPQNIRSSETKI